MLKKLRSTFTKEYSFAEMENEKRFDGGVDWIVSLRQSDIIIIIDQLFIYFEISGSYKTNEEWVSSISFGKVVES